MDEQQRNEMLYEAIQKAYEQLENLTPGSEEHKRQVEAIKFLEDIVTDKGKAAYETLVDYDRKKLEKGKLIVSAIGLVAIPLLALLMQYKVDCKLMHIEEFGSMASHKAFDHKLVNLIGVFRRNNVV